MGGARGRPGPGRAWRPGFDGLFLDTLNVELTFPEDVPHLLTLVAAIRDRGRAPAYLLANRGFGMLPRLAELVDGVVFESFSARWTDEGYAPWPPDVLEFHAQIAEQLLQLQLDLYALDYADTPGLTEFADAAGAAVRHAVRGQRPGAVPGLTSTRAPTPPGQGRRASRSRPRDRHPRWGWTSRAWAETSAPAWAETSGPPGPRRPRRKLGCGEVGASVRTQG